MPKGGCSKSAIGFECTWFFARCYYSRMNIVFEPLCYLIVPVPCNIIWCDCSFGVPDIYSSNAVPHMIPLFIFAIIRYPNGDARGVIHGKCNVVETSLTIIGKDTEINFVD